MARLRMRAALSLPIVVFLLFSSVLMLRGRPGAWHSRCLELWQQQDWAGLQGLATNLQLLGTPDTEVEYFAAMAARHDQNPQAYARFAGLWRERRALNWNWERDLTASAASAGLLERLTSYRVRGTTALLILLVPMNLMAFRRPRWILGCSFLSCVGLILLLV